MEIKVLGPGCAKCKATIEQIGKVAKEIGVAVELTKVEGMREIVGFGIMSTPGVAIDGKIVHVGSVPTHDQVKEWMT
ncbi:MAG: small redox-active disulfide protein 2 [Pseudorhodobacter sp.]|jgi:small redox-active disulfide protein 2